MYSGNEKGPLEVPVLLRVPCVSVDILRIAAEFGEKKKRKLDKLSLRPICGPLLSGHETKQLFLTLSESAARAGRRLPKINRLSVQPQGWVGVSHHGAHTLQLSLPPIKTRRLAPSACLHQNAALFSPKFKRCDGETSCFQALHVGSLKESALLEIDHSHSERLHVLCFLQVRRQIIVLGR